METVVLYPLRIPCMDSRFRGRDVGASGDTCNNYLLHGFVHTRTRMRGDSIDLPVVHCRAIELDVELWQEPIGG